MKWIVVIILALLGLIELFFRGVLLLLLVLSIVGLFVLEGASHFLKPNLWVIAREVAGRYA